MISALPAWLRLVLAINAYCSICGHHRINEFLLNSVIMSRSGWGNTEPDFSSVAPAKYNDRLYVLAIRLTAS
jgi:hypothetical protein